MESCFIRSIFTVAIVRIPQYLWRMGQKISISFDTYSAVYDKRNEYFNISEREK